MNTLTNQTGAIIPKILGWLVATPVILIVLGVAFTETNKAYWDHRVKQMCEKDGGVTVYEKVVLARDELNNLRIAPATQKTDEDDYFLQDSAEVINSSPRVRKFVGLLYRNLDKKLIAKQIIYSRIGGDMPTGITAASSYSCDEAGISTEIVKSTFFIKGQ